ncbi:B12-binding domain-containing radical SAM protein [Marinobacterium sp. YM272]|uniref:B12-binding domain-containing radical SAM protein n=1 Tax=Marinobacterium sp. YM272 TaxID=3421654 RepID=UPI003D7F80C5
MNQPAARSLAENLSRAARRFRSPISKLNIDGNPASVLQIIIIRPTRYDDDGYPIQWYRASLPSNSLACVNGLALDSAERKVLGENVEIRVTAFDEASDVVSYPKLIKKLEASGHNVLVCLAGVQSNQFPRAMDIAEIFRKANMQVCLGGFHVTGSISMLKELPEELIAAQQMGVSLFSGEAENGRFDLVVKDAWSRSLKPLYDFTSAMTDLEGEPFPYLPLEMIEGNITSLSTIDLGRGCPFTCSFCCIINVQGRKSRSRSVDDLEKMIRRIFAEGSKHVFITDDNLARNKDWEAHFDRLIELRKEGIKLSLVIQVDTLCHKIPGFIEKAVAAGVKQVFVGLENINPENLVAMKKRQNKITEYRKMLLEWKKFPVLIWGAYILGLPGDTRKSILRDIDIIKKELPIDLFNPSVLTPLPGSEDHLKMRNDGVWMDPDLNKYDLTHRVIHHPNMSDEEFDKLYVEAWDRYYTKEQMETVLKRMFALKSNLRLITVERLIGFGVVTRVNNLRSYDMGLFRRKNRLARRKGFAKEPFLSFHMRNTYQSLRNVSIIYSSYRKLYKLMRRLDSDPKKLEYTDTAITWPNDDEMEVLQMYTDTQGGKGAVEKHERLKAKRIRDAAAVGTFQPDPQS